MPDRSTNSLEAWRLRITEGEAFMKPWYPWWDVALAKLQPKLTDDPKHRGECIDTGRGFAHVEQKTPQTFFKEPELVLKPSPLMEGGYQDPATGQQISYGSVLQTHQAILNEKLGPDHVDAVRLWKRTIRSQIGIAGVGVSVMGYEQVATTIEPPEQPGSFLKLSAPVEQPIYSECFWTDLSAKKLLMPAGTTEPDADKWPWIGYRWTMPVRQAIRTFKLPEGFTGKVTRDEHVLDHGLQQTNTQDLVTGVTVWYLAYLFDPDVVHPKIRRTLTIIDGLDRFAEAPVMKYQTLDDFGQLTPDSLDGYPVIVQTPRDVPDTPIPQSDVAVMTPLFNELDKYREQQLRTRDANIALRGVDMSRVSQDTVTKIENGTIGSLIPFDQPIDASMFAELATAKPGRESWLGNDYLDNDLARVGGMDANQMGAQSSETKTASEAQIQQGNTNVRIDEERTVQLRGYVKAVTKYSVLVQRYLTVEQAAKIVGMPKAQIWAQVMKQLPAPLAFTAKPDSATRVDAAAERKRVMEEYSFYANDPLINRQELLRQTLTRGGWNADQLIIQPQPPSPEPAKGNLSIDLAELANPALTQAVVETLAVYGVKLSPQAVQAASILGPMVMQANAEAGAVAKQPPHGGKVSPMENLDKHHAERTGAMQGTGQSAPMGPGGMMM